MDLVPAERQADLKEPSQSSHTAWVSLSQRGHLSLTLSGMQAHGETGIDIPRLMSSLARRRPVFHSEADFQHSLAWQIQLEHPSAEIRLETRPRRNIHLDLLVGLNGVRIAVELKYLVAGFTGTVAGEQFELPNGGAQDLSRHDSIKDIVRIETLVHDGYAAAGYVVVLASDPSYWRPALRQDTIDAAFRLHEGRILDGVIGWAAHAGSGTTKGRDAPLVLSGRYTCHWSDYSTVSAGRGKQVSFRHLTIAVPTHQSSAQPSQPQSHTTPIVARSSPVPASSSMQSFVAMPVREQIIEAARDLTARSPDGSFTPAQVVAELRRRGSTYEDSTIRTHVVSVMCANAPDHHMINHADLIRVDRGRYRLA